MDRIHGRSQSAADRRLRARGCRAAAAATSSDHRLEFSSARMRVYEGLPRHQPGGATFSPARGLLDVDGADVTGVRSQSLEIVGVARRNDRATGEVVSRDDERIDRQLGTLTDLSEQLPRAHAGGPELLPGRAYPHTIDRPPA